MFDKSETEVLDKLKAWASLSNNIRALILTSSRVGPNTKPDKLSDYDIEVIVDDLEPFSNDEWLSYFGTTLVKWPLYPRNTGYTKNSISRLVVFTSFPRVDFQINNKIFFDASVYDSGYKFIVDKDNLQSTIPKPTNTEYIIKRPSAEDFYEAVDGFYWDLPYIAKSLKRGELAFARFMLLSAIRYDSFDRMLSWYVGSKNNWAANYGVHGRNLEKLTNKPFANKVNSLEAGNNSEDIWQNALNMEKLFRRMHEELANSLQYKKEVVNTEQVILYCQKILELSLEK